MGICWSEPPAKQVVAVLPTAPPPQNYMPPPSYNPNYTYAVKPQEQMYYGYPQQYQQQYPQQYVQYQQFPVYQPRQTVSPGTAFVGGLVVGSIIEDILDPTD